MTKAEDRRVVIIGGGLAGCEAAWQLLKRGFSVRMFEQRPRHSTPAHECENLAELVCSNSFRSNSLTSAAGLLKAEMRMLDSLIIAAADASKVPAGQALAVDRNNFSSFIEQKLNASPRFELVRERVDKIPADGHLIIASGPLTSDALASSIAEEIGTEYLYFYDAIAPIVAADSVDLDHAFFASRYDKGEGHYLNCPLNAEEYRHFLRELRSADYYPTHDSESDVHFEGCLPIEEMARRGDDVLRFGPMKPVGLEDPKTGKMAYAVLQLRQDDLAAEHYNLVGFQTKMRQSEQRRVFGNIPALKSARYYRFGQMHRNSYINSPTVLSSAYQVKSRQKLFIAGQLSGVEGYVESAASGLAAGWYLSQWLRAGEVKVFPRSTAIGALGAYIASTNPKGFQPVKITFGLLEKAGIKFRGPRRARREAQSENALSELKTHLEGPSRMESGI